jgi:hypothetical protein
LTDIWNVVDQVNGPWYFDFESGYGSLPCSNFKLLTTDTPMDSLRFDVRLFSTVEVGAGCVYAQVAKELRLMARFLNSQAAKLEKEALVIATWREKRRQQIVTALANLGAAEGPAADSIDTPCVGEKAVA